MLIRISLIIAIVAGLAAAGLGFIKVKEKITLTMTERDDEKTQKEAAQKERDATKKTLKKTEEDLSTTKKTLATTQKDLEGQTARAEELDKQKADLTTQLGNVKGERDTAQDKLIAWDNIGLTPDQVKKTISDLKVTKKERDTSVADNKVLSRENKRMQAKIDDLIGSDQPVILPTGLKGNVVAVDPKFDFVVLNIGGNQGVLERGEMLVNRRGKLVAKIRIASVSPERSVANILPEWKQAEVMEGDQVIY